MKGGFVASADREIPISLALRPAAVDDRFEGELLTLGKHMNYCFFFFDSRVTLEITSRCGIVFQATGRSNTSPTR